MKIKRTKVGPKPDESPLGPPSKVTFPKRTSGVPYSSGGSRQGNIGHEGEDDGGNSHR